MIADLRIAVRTTRKAPAFYIVAALTLALGIGVNSAIFSAINCILLEPLPGRDTGRLVKISEVTKDGHWFVHPTLFDYWRRHSRSFDQIAGQQMCSFTMTGAGEPIQPGTPCTTANWFDLWGIPPLLGRTFEKGDDQPGHNHVAVLDYGFWLRHFAGDPKVIGRKVLLDKVPYEVVGVMPMQFAPLGARTAELYVPYVVEQNRDTGIIVTAHLRRGISLQSAQQELNLLAANLTRSQPDFAQRRAELQDLLDSMVGSKRSLLLILLGAVTLVLLIASANVAHLSLARCSARQPEIAIRVSLGATRRHIVRVLLAESTLIAATGCALGVGLAFVAVRLFPVIAPEMPRVETIQVDAVVLLYVAALAALSTVLFGLLPSLAVTRPARSDARVAGLRGIRVRSLVAASEFAFALVLLAGAGLLLRSFALMRAVDLGYEPRGVVLMFLVLPESHDGSRQAGLTFYERIQERIRALPGVRSAAVATAVPMGGVGISGAPVPEGEAERPNERSAHWSIVNRDYFRTLGIPVLRGRLFGPQDREGSLPVAIVSRRVAEHYFPGQNPIGKRIQFPALPYNLSDIDGDHALLREIVGIVGDVRHVSVSDRESQDVYIPETQNAIRLTDLVVKAEGDPMRLVPAIKAAIYAENPELPVTQVHSMDELTGYLTEGPRQGMWLLGLFAVLALVLSAVGIYGVMSYTTALRSREIGVRMALGARPRDVMSMIGGEACRIAVIGISGGVLAGLALTRFLASLLYGVTPSDPLTFFGAALLLFAIAVAAAAGPAKTAARVDPNVALRE